MIRLKFSFKNIKKPNSEAQFLNAINYLIIYSMTVSQKLFNY